MLSLLKINFCWAPLYRNKYLLIHFYPKVKLTLGLLKELSAVAENGLSCRDGVDTAASLIKIKIMLFPNLNVKVDCKAIDRIK